MNIEQAGNISDEVVDFLRQERIRQGISRYKLAKDCGLSKTSIAYIENFENKPTLRSLLMIAECLGVDLGKLIAEAIKDHKKAY